VPVPVQYVGDAIGEYAPHATGYAALFVLYVMHEPPVYPLAYVHEL
jgi:hypothetical protein